ncbi:MAG TPA: DUF1080 domain-containing protein [Bryobacteraceae bacterium]|nr:DUF1080 domain-containing protein [Bryobacteraceae bacterium]
MRSGWAFRSLSLAALFLVSAAPAPAQSFTSMFDGKTLQGWDGDPMFWRVENGAIVGETKPDKMPKQNTFLIWRGGTPADFELDAEYRLSGGNSGIQYRSSELPDIRWAMKGYQADIDAEQQYTGQIYEERGRGFLALRGQAARIQSGAKPMVLGSLGGDGELKSVIRSHGWNDYRIIARGNILVQILNSRVMSMLIDDDAANRKMDGLIGIQLHTGEPMKIEIRNIRIKKL